VHAGEGNGDPRGNTCVLLSQLPLRLGLWPNNFHGLCAF